MKKKFLSILFALVLLLTLGLVTAVPVAAQGTLEVGLGKTYTTIQAAIDAASSGDTILVAAGTYNEQVIIEYPASNISLVGAGRDNTTIDAGSTRGGAIDIQGASHITISGFTLRNRGEAEPYNDYGINIEAYGFPATAWSTYITVEDCTLDADDYGIEVHNDRQASHNIFRRNIITSDWGGIHLRYTSQNTVTQNTISNATGWAGINLGTAGDDNTVQYNVISGCKYGVNLVMSQGGPSGNVISNNEITNNERGIWWQGGPSNTVTENNIYSNTYNLYAGTSVVAEDNWWGQDPPDATKFYGTVDYAPWSTSSNPIVPPPVEVWVDDGFTDGTPGWDVTHFATIQAGVNAVAEDGTVNVAAGTYNANIDINKRITLQGAGSGNDPANDTIIASVAANVPVINITASGASAEDRLTVRDLRVTGASGSGHGILVDSSLNTVEHLSFENVTAVNNGTSATGVGSNFFFNYATNDMGDVIIDTPYIDNGFTGVLLHGSEEAKFDGLKILGGQINNNRAGGFLSGQPDSLDATNIEIDGTQFNNNGSNVGNFGNIIFQIFEGNATVKNVDINTTLPTAYAIQFRGNNGETSGNIILDTINVTGANSKVSLLVQEYADVSGFSLSNVDVSGATGAWGTVAIGHSDPGGFDLGTTTLPNLVLWEGGGNVDATQATFVGTTTNFEIEDKVNHALDVSGLGLVTWVPGNLYVTQDSGSIQRAIDAASDGDTINVAAGEYVENVVIAESLDLVGAGRETTTIDGNNVGNTITITASDVTVSGFTVTGGYADPNYPLGGSQYTGTWIWTPLGGVVINGNDGTSALTGITIEDNIIHGNAGNGIFVSAAGDGGEAGNVVIRRNEIYNNGEPEGDQTAGISITYLYYQGQSSQETWEEWRRPKNILVEENNIDDNHEFGIYLCSAKDCVIRLNEISFSSRKGLLMAPSMPCTETPSEHNTVEQNQIHDNALNGIKLFSYNHHNTFTGNTIYGNGFGAPGDRDDFKYGFLFQDGNDNTVENNVIYNNAGGGLYLWGKGDPSYTWYSTTNNNITRNTIYDHTGGCGIYIPARAEYPNSGFLNSHINQNNITNNLYGLVNEDTTQIVDAKYNWWGKIGGPGGEGLGNGDNVSAYVDYDPWLTEDFHKVITDGIAYFGSTISLEPGWNTLSVPLKLKDSANTMALIAALGDFLISSGTTKNWEIVYQYKSGSDWENIGSSDTVLDPLRGYYIKILGTDTVDFPVLYSGQLGLPTLELSKGWNLIGSGFGIEKTDYGIAATDNADGQKDVATALYSIKDECSVVVSPSTQGQVAAWGTTVIDIDKDMIVGEAYWVFMTAKATLAGFEVTPIYYLP